MRTQNARILTCFFRFFRFFLSLVSMKNCMWRVVNPKSNDDHDDDDELLHTPIEHTEMICLALVRSLDEAQRAQIVVSLRQFFV